MESPKTYDGKKHVPVPSGRYVVGCTDIMVGSSVSDEDDGGCFFRLYFPTQIQEDAFKHSSRWATWLPHYNYLKGFKHVLDDSYYTRILGKIPYLMEWIIWSAVGNCYIPVVEDAEPSNQQQFPVIVFSHGLASCRTSYSTFCSEISSHGYIVAAIEHRDGSGPLSYVLETDDTGNSKEKWIPYKPSISDEVDLPLRREQLKVRIRESQQTLDFLFKLNNGDLKEERILFSSIDIGLFKGIMDLTTPVIAGHSFGSATLLRTLAIDKRFKMGVAMDTWMWPIKEDVELAKEIEQPLLFINMENFQEAPDLEAMKRFTVDADHTERRVVTLKGTVHKNQVDVSLLMTMYQRLLIGGNSTINPFLAMELNNRIALLYLHKHLGQAVDEEHLKFVETHKEWIFEGIP